MKSKCADEAFLDLHRRNDQVKDPKLNVRIINGDATKVQKKTLQLHDTIRLRTFVSTFSENPSVQYMPELIRPINNL